AWLMAVWQDDPVGGAALTMLALTFLVALVVAVIVELRALRRLREVGRFRSELEAAMAQDSHRLLSSALAPVLKLVEARRPDLVRDFRHRVEGQTDCTAMIRQFRIAVLTPLDQEARRAV